MTAIFKREFRAAYRSVFGYVVAALLWIAEGFSMVLNNLIGTNASFESSLGIPALLLCVIVPLLCMRSVSEDRQAHAKQLLAFLPVSPFEVVLGRFLALYAVLMLPLLAYAVLPLLLCCFGTVWLGSAYLSLLTFYLLVGAVLALCTFLSALTESPVLSLVISLIACGLLYCFTLFGSLLPADGLAAFILLLAIGTVAAVCFFASSRNLLLGVGVLGFFAVGASVLYFLFPAVTVELADRIVTYLSPFAWFDVVWYNSVFDIRGVVLMLSFAVFFLAASVITVYRRRGA